MVKNITRKVVICKCCGEATLDFGDGFCETCPPELWINAKVAEDSMQGDNDAANAD